MLYIKDYTGKNDLNPNHMGAKYVFVVFGGGTYLAMVLFNWSNFRLMYLLHMFPNFTFKRHWNALKKTLLFLHTCASHRSTKDKTFFIPCILTCIYQERIFNFKNTLTFKCMELSISLSRKSRNHEEILIYMGYRLFICREDRKK